MKNTNGVTWGGGEVQGAEFWIFCSHSSTFQVAYSSIISSLNATPVVYYRYQFFVSISFTTFRITAFSWRKNWPIVPRCRRYNGPLGGTQQIYWNFADLVASDLYLFNIHK